MRGADMIISFAGHSSVSRGEKLCELVKEQIIKNANADDPITFYLGGYGDFDEIFPVTANVVTKLEQVNDGVERPREVYANIIASAKDALKEVREYKIS